MMLAPFDDFPTAVKLIDLAIHVAGGAAAGLLYFGGLWRSARLFAEGGLKAAVGLTIGRFALLAGVLTLVSLEGALPLLMTALGLLAGRWAVMHRVRERAA
ncbi:MAG TPA: ATP synthase subunit I [Aliidongia sp.]|nr:ATP synthase subunit I [Aliidongia sp.]